MTYSKQEWWQRFQKHYTEFAELDLALDLSRMNISDEFLADMEARAQKALADMAALEKGAVANPDEGRMVGHYWLRNPALAPTPEIRRQIEDNIAEIQAFAAAVHTGAIHGAAGSFKNYLLIGIGGSALGPQFVAHALGNPTGDRVRPYFFDNTDPDGMARTLAIIGNDLSRTLCIVISKSGGTRETQNGMLIAKAAYERQGLEFGRHTVAVTTEGSKLDAYAVENRWLARFPMWDWVGGRTSELSSVGLLPASLQGLDITEFLKGASASDTVTRGRSIRANPALQLAMGMFESGNGNGVKNMVVLPYRDRLELFSKYLQQLVMESLGKESDLNGNTVHQGITVFGNKGSTDQHSYIQQLRDGPDDFFAVFIEVLNDGSDGALMVDNGTTAGDYLHGFLLGTRQALAEKGRESITITIKEVSAFSVGVLIALFERAVGFYASMVNINAYHQPGVEAGKKAAVDVIDVQKRIVSLLTNHAGKKFSVAEISQHIAQQHDEYIILKVCNRLAMNPSRAISKESGRSPFDSKYGFVQP